MLLGALIMANVNHPDDYRKNSVDVMGVVIKESGSQCRVHVIELDGQPVDRVMRMHSGHFRVLSR